MKTEGKLKQWHPVEFAGIWMLMDEPFYEGRDQLNADYVGEDNAKNNAKLAASAPELLELLHQMAEYYIHEKKYEIEDLAEMIDNVIITLKKFKKKPLLFKCKCGYETNSSLGFTYHTDCCTFEITASTPPLQSKKPNQ